MAEATRTWLITGCSTGLGRALAELLIAKGERVFATARKPEELSDLVASHKNARALKLDVTMPTDIKAAVAEVEQMDLPGLLPHLDEMPADLDRG